MRAAVLLLLASCADQGSSGFGGPGSTLDSSCEADTQCPTGDVCARDGSCMPPSEVRAIRVTWTVNGMAASATTCADAPNLAIAFASDSHGYYGALTYAPVPCAEGVFSVDKMPVQYIDVGLGEGAGGGPLTPIDPTTGDAAIDLEF